MLHALKLLTLSSLLTILSTLLFTNYETILCIFMFMFVSSSRVQVSQVWAVDLSFTPQIPPQYLEHAHKVFVV